LRLSRRSEFLIAQPTGSPPGYPAKVHQHSAHPLNSIEWLVRRLAIRENVPVINRSCPFVRSTPMVQRIAWFERTFTFDLPIWMYPNIVERLRGTPARLEDRVRFLPQEILTRRDGDKWSIQEHVGHLLDLGSLDIARLDDYAMNREVLQPADRENRKTYAANPNANAIENILEAFREERMEFVRRLDQFDEEFIVRIALHLRLKAPMRVLDFAFFVAEHDDHHLASITELIGKLAE
jgi:uncharacterized damage-inducible protein DinB